MKISHPNRPNKRKNKKGGGCKMCKPHKGKWGSRLKERDKNEHQQQNKAILRGKLGTS